jgi:hypothetical protein
VYGNYASQIKGGIASQAKDKIRSLSVYNTQGKQVVFTAQGVSQVVTRHKIATAAAVAQSV